MEFTNISNDDVFFFVFFLFFYYDTNVRTDCVVMHFLGFLAHCYVLLWYFGWLSQNNSTEPE